MTPAALPEMQLFGHYDEVAQMPELDVGALVIGLGVRQPDDVLHAGLGSCRSHRRLTTVLLGGGCQLRE